MLVVLYSHLNEVVCIYCICIMSPLFLHLIFICVSFVLYLCFICVEIVFAFLFYCICVSLVLYLHFICIVFGKEIDRMPNGSWDRSIYCPSHHIALSQQHSDCGRKCTNTNTNINMSLMTNRAGLKLLRNYNKVGHSV